MYCTCVVWFRSVFTVKRFFVFVPANAHPLPELWFERHGLRKREVFYLTPWRTLKGGISTRTRWKHLCNLRQPTQDSAISGQTFCVEIPVYVRVQGFWIYSGGEAFDFWRTAGWLHERFRSGKTLFSLLGNQAGSFFQSKSSAIIILWEIILFRIFLFWNKEHPVFSSGFSMK